VSVPHPSSPLFDRPWARDLNFDLVKLRVELENGQTEFDLIFYLNLKSQKET
jgi:hypothetical protein